MWKETLLQLFIGDRPLIQYLWQVLFQPLGLIMNKTDPNPKLVELTFWHRDLGP